MKNFLEEISQKVKTKCHDFDLIYNKGSSMNLTTQEQNVDQYNVASSQVLGIRVCNEDRVGISYTETLDESAIETCIKQAMENAKASDINEYEGIHVKADKDLIENNSEIFVSEEVTNEEKINKTLQMEEASKNSDALISAVPYNGFSESIYEYAYLSSLGTYCESREKYYSCYSSALFKQNNNSSMHYHGAIARKFSDLDWKDCTDRSVEHAKAWLHGEPVGTGHYHVLFTPGSLQSLLGCFGHVFSAKSAWEKTNPWREKLGEQVTDSRLQIQDCPRYPGTFSPDLFDSEGMEMEDLELIKDGKLVNFYHNTATAKYFDTKTNARASRSARGPLGVSGSTKVILAGNNSESDFRGEKYIEIHSMQGLHSGANAFSGDFSFAASGYLYENGERKQAVKGVTVAGNIFEVLNKIKFIGDQVKPNDSRNFFTPDILFGDMSIAGS